AQSRVELRPSAEPGILCIHVDGQANVPLTARKQPATLSASNRMQFAIDQFLYVYPTGIAHVDPIIHVTSQTSLRGVSLDFRSPLIRRLATPIVARVASKNLSQGDGQAARKAQQQIEQQLAQQAFVT